MYPKKPSPASNAAKSPIASPKSGSELVVQQPSLNNMTESSNMMALQRSIGNQATMKLVGQSGGTHVQRLMSRQNMIDKAGEPEKDRVFGLKKMSVKYRSVLDKLTHYQQQTSTTMSYIPSLPGSAAGLGHALDDLNDACTVYINEHLTDQQRTPHIRQLRDIQIPEERQLITLLVTASPQVLENIGDKPLSYAIGMMRDLKSLTAATTYNKTLPGQEDRRQAAQTYESYLGAGNAGLTGLINQQTGQAGNQPFRGSDDLTLKGKALSDVMGQDYIRATLMPLIANTMGDLIGKEYTTNALSTRLPGADTSNAAQTTKDERTFEAVRSIYGEFVRGMLINTQGGSLIPQEILTAAAATFARVYNNVEDNPAAVHTALQAARVSVVNMIFLRFINPAIIEIASKVSKENGVQGILIRMSGMIQAQVNHVDYFIKNVDMQGIKGEMDAVQGILDNVVDTVVQRGMVLAQAQRVPVVTRTRGKVVTGR